MQYTLTALMQEGAEVLRRAGVESAGLDSRLLLQHALGIAREEMLRAPEKMVDEAEARHYKGLLQRRASREPLSHITGSREFWGRDFTVSRATLDPRPDSETLIETVLKRLPDRTLPLKLLDLGTGTGCLMLTLLAEYPNAIGVGVDVSSDALKVAEENCVNLGLEKRVQFLLQYWGRGLTGTFDVIISNPPYIKNIDINRLQPEVSVYEPYMALAGGEDGLQCYREIAPDIARLLSKDGFAVLEFGQGQQTDVSTILSNNQLQTLGYACDLAGVVRCVVVCHKPLSL